MKSKGKLYSKHSSSFPPWHRHAVSTQADDDPLYNSSHRQSHHHSSHWRHAMNLSSSSRNSRHRVKFTVEAPGLCKYSHDSSVSQILSCMSLDSDNSFTKPFMNLLIDIVKDIPPEISYLHKDLIVDALSHEELSLYRIRKSGAKVMLTSSDSVLKFISKRQKQNRRPHIYIGILQGGSSSVNPPEQPSASMKTSSRVSESSSTRRSGSPVKPSDSMKTSSRVSQSSSSRRSGSPVRSDAHGSKGRRVTFRDSMKTSSRVSESSSSSRRSGSSVRNDVHAPKGRQVKFSGSMISSSSVSESSLSRRFHSSSPKRIHYPARTDANVSKERLASQTHVHECDDSQKPFSQQTPSSSSDKISPSAQTDTQVTGLSRFARNAFHVCLDSDALSSKLCFIIKTPHRELGKICFSPRDFVDTHSSTLSGFQDDCFVAFINDQLIPNIGVTLPHLVKAKLKLCAHEGRLRLSRPKSQNSKRLVRFGSVNSFLNYIRQSHSMTHSPPVIFLEFDRKSGILLDQVFNDTESQYHSAGVSHLSSERELTSSSPYDLKSGKEIMHLPEQPSDSTILLSRISTSDPSRRIHSSVQNNMKASKGAQVRLHDSVKPSDKQQFLVGRSVTRSVASAEDCDPIDSSRKILCEDVRSPLNVTQRLIQTASRRRDDKSSEVGINSCTTESSHRGRSRRVLHLHSSPSSQNTSIKGFKSKLQASSLDSNPLLDSPGVYSRDSHQVSSSKPQYSDVLLDGVLDKGALDVMALEQSTFVDIVSDSSSVKELKMRLSSSNASSSQQDQVIKSYVHIHAFTLPLQRVHRGADPSASSDSNRRGECSMDDCLVLCVTKDLFHLPRPPEISFQIYSCVTVVSDSTFRYGSNSPATAVNYGGVIVTKVHAISPHVKSCLSNKTPFGSACPIEAFRSSDHLKQVSFTPTGNNRLSSSSLQGFGIAQILRKYFLSEGIFHGVDNDTVLVLYSIVQSTIMEFGKEISYLLDSGLTSPRHPQDYHVLQRNYMSYLCVIKQWMKIPLLIIAGTFLVLIHQPLL